MRDFFKDCIVLDMANNHYGSVDHARETIEAFAEELELEKLKREFDVFIKFQYRDLPSFVNKADRGSDTKYVRRFLDTALTYSEFAGLMRHAEGCGFSTMITPFDEQSVSVALIHHPDALKVASCSARDFRLMRNMCQGGLPIAISCGGLTMPEIDNIVSFMDHQGAEFALNHCVSIYPCPEDALHLEQIAQMKERYPHLVIGWSTHEDPDHLLVGASAYALGARMFERHIGLPFNDEPLNRYSSSPEQVKVWIDTLLTAKRMIKEKSDPQEVMSYCLYRPNAEEKETLCKLKRGCFAREDLKPGDLHTTDMYYAIPTRAGQMTTDDLTENMTLHTMKSKDEPLWITDVSSKPPKYFDVKQAIHDIKAMLNYAGIALPPDFETEFSHHYGPETFYMTGVTMITIFNRYYAKKLLFVTPGQTHPEHYHKLKEESFLILWGVLDSKVDGVQRTLKPGDSVTIMPGTWHSFGSKIGCIFEEISTTAISGDSVYRDPAIACKTEAERKTRVRGWGRFELTQEDV